MSSIPGGTGDKARALRELVAKPALEEGRSPEELVSPQAMLRLLYQRPQTGEGLAATTGVGLRGKWVLPATLDEDAPAIFSADRWATLGDDVERPSWSVRQDRGAPRGLVGCYCRLPPSGGAATAGSTGSRRAAEGGWGRPGQGPGSARACEG